MNSTHSSRAKRRIKRVIEHRLRIQASIIERQKVFNEMEALTFENLNKMLEGHENPGFLMNRECDEDDYFRNTDLFKTEVERYLESLYAVDAEYTDPDGVTELLAHAENLQLIPGTSKVLEVAVTYNDTTITVSENNLHDSTKTVDPLNLNVVDELRTLPPELQEQVSDNFSCPEKIILGAHGIAIKPCSPPHNISYHLDQRPSVTHVSSGIADDYGIEVPCRPNGYGFCNHQPVEFEPREVTFTIRGTPITEYVMAPKFELDVRYQSDKIKSLTVQGYNLIYNKRPRPKKRGCICQSQLFQRPTLIRHRSFVAALAHVGYYPPRRRHLCALGSKPKLIEL